MTKSKVTKRSVIMSGIALLICLVMLVGTTFAWFSDSVTSGGNIIKSGTLNIDLGIKATGDNDYVSVKNNPTKVAFNYDKWEPGYTEWVNAKVFTTGNLALKYTMKIVANGTASDLAKVIDVYYAPTEVAKPATRDLSGLTLLGTLDQAISGTLVINDTLIPGENEADFATLALHMQESAGNEYQDLAIGTDFSIQILATQYTYEADSFDDQYDADAEFDTSLVVKTPAQLAEIIDQINSFVSDPADTDPDANINETSITVAAGTYDQPILIDLFPNPAQHNSANNGYVSNIADADANIVNLKADGEVIMTAPLTIKGAGNSAKSGPDYLAQSKASVVIDGFTFDAELAESGNTVLVDLTESANDITFKNCTFKDQTHINIGHAADFRAGKVVFENCTFDKAACFSGYWSDLQIVNCTGNIDSGKAKGFINAQGGGSTLVKGCTFDVGNVAYLVRTNSDVNATMENCAFTGTPVKIVIFRESGSVVTFKSCTLNGAPITAEPSDGVGTSGTIIIE